MLLSAGTEPPTAAPFTANCWPPLSVAVRMSIVIGSGVLALPIVQDTRWLPFEQTVEPEGTALCAKAGAAVATTKTPTTAAMPAASVPRRRTAWPTRLLISVLKVPPQAMNRVR